jgi:cell division protein FtsL
VVNAENTIADAEQKISKDEPGYQTLQQAKNRFETGEYSEAEKLAQNALDQQQNKQRGSTLPWVLIAATLATLVLVIAIGYYGYQHWIENQIDQEVREIREKVLQEDGEVSNAGEVRTELGKAEKALDMDKHRQAKKSLDRIRGLLDR